MKDNDFKLLRGFDDGQMDSRLVTDQTRFKSEAGHSIFVCEYVIYEHPQLYFKPNMQFRSAVFGFRCGSANTRISLN